MVQISRTRYPDPLENKNMENKIVNRLGGEVQAHPPEQSEVGRSLSRVETTLSEIWTLRPTISNTMTSEASVLAKPD
ncbi:hypothetical protein RvY_17684 [Ramazzottius varieornatus]|uniref:Uncharacterized protein n=1 Tax=Ramazzottius varieornatus TaxID=947166 RepID=A0A1D1W8R4_RAMVA|nr:hypothetical protein RvY_17684 [Ramazzottius varieornatus]